MIYVVLGMLAVISIIDIRQKAVPLYMLVVFILASFCMKIFSEDFSSVTLLYGFIPGAIILLISFVTRGKIGYGDGLALVGIGGYCGIVKAFSAFAAAIILSAVFGACMMMFKKKGKDYVVPFLPFLFAGCIIVLICEL